MQTNVCSFKHPLHMNGCSCIHVKTLQNMDFVQFFGRLAGLQNAQKYWYFFVQNAYCYLAPDGV